ncbi:hypothetical protein P8C59_003088 [Phyllachora maydis]|uniref:Integrase catalytic domain-containing protein n=1 Tax=Phyllachora maydis TaxID=1825666 RepID=A0AAD9I149_9PEZI|nr:hypothetical protein P8C59_003088 [Phyllachora maydis]
MADQAKGKEDKEDSKDYSKVIEVLKQHIKSHKRVIASQSSDIKTLLLSLNTLKASIKDSVSAIKNISSTLASLTNSSNAATTGKTSYSPRFDPFSGTIDLDSPLRPPRKEPHLGPAVNSATSNLDPPIDIGSKEGFKDTITSSIVKELSKKAYTIPDDSKLSGESNFEHTYKKGLSAFNTEFNGYLAKLTIAKIDIDPSLILNYLNIEYLIADILEESRNPATEAYRAAYIANSSNSTPNSNSNPSKEGKNKKKGKKKASYNVKGQNYSAKSAEQASFVLESYNLAIEEEEESDSSSNSSSSSDSNTQLAQLLALKGYKKRKDFKGKGLKTSSNKAKYKDNQPRRRPRDPALYNSQVRPINTGNGPVSPAGIGSITLEVLSRKAPPTYTKLVLDNVLYLPNIDINIISRVRHYDSGGCLIKETLYRGDRRYIAVLDFKKSGLFLNVKGSSKPILHTNFAFPLGLSSYTTKSIEPQRNKIVMEIPSNSIRKEDYRPIIEDTIVSEAIEPNKRYKLRNSPAKGTTLEVIEGNKVVEKAISSPTLKEPNIGLCLLKKTSSITKGLPNFDKIKEADFHCSSYDREGDTVKIRPRPYNRNPIVLLLVNHKSRYRWVFNLPNKSGPIVANAIKGFFRGLRNGFGRYPTKFHFNRGTEITDLLTTWLAKRGIKFSTSAPYIHKQNGLVERSVRVILDLELVNSTAITNKETTPFQALFDELEPGIPYIPNLERYRAIGARGEAIIHLEKQSKSLKFTSRTEECKLLVVLGTKTYLVYIPSRRAVLKTSTVKFIEDNIVLKGAVSLDPSNLNTEKPISIEIGPSKLEPYESSSDKPIFAPKPIEVIAPNQPITNVPLDNSDLILEGDKMQLDYYKLLAKTSSYILSFVYKARKRVISKDSTPTTYKQVLKLPKDKRSKWLEAITKEFIQLLELGVFKFLPRSLLPSNLAKGFIQVEGLDYTVTYASTSILPTWRILLAIDLGVFYNAKTCHFIVTYIDDCLFIGPDIGYITDLKKRLNKLSRSLNRPTKSHLTAAKNLFKYLNSTKDYSICFSYNGNTVADLGPKLSNSSNTTTKLSRDFHSKEGPRPLTTTSTTIVDSKNSKGSSRTSIINSSLVPIDFSDSDFTGDKATSKSTYGYLYKLAGRPISWKTKRATTISLSTLEAKLDRLTEAIHEVQWIIGLFSELYRPIDYPITLYRDNQGSITVANNPALHARTTYTLLKFRYIREQVKAKIVTIVDCGKGGQVLIPVTA